MCIMIIIIDIFDADQERPVDVGWPKYENFGISIYGWTLFSEIFSLELRKPKLKCKGVQDCGYWQAQVVMKCCVIFVSYLH